MSNFPNSFFSTTSFHDQQESGTEFSTSDFTSSSHSTRSDSPSEESHCNDFYNSGIGNYCEVTSDQNDYDSPESAGATGFDFSNPEIDLLGEWATDPFSCLTLNQTKETESNKSEDEECNQLKETYSNQSEDEEYNQTEETDSNQSEDEEYNQTEEADSNQSEDEEYNQLEETESNQPEDKKSNQLYFLTHRFQSSVKGPTYARGTHTRYTNARTHMAHPQVTRTWSSQGTSDGGATFCRPDSSDDSSADDEDSRGASNQYQSVALVSAFVIKYPKKVCKMLVKTLAKCFLSPTWAAAVHCSLDFSIIITNLIQGNYIAAAFDAFFLLIDRYLLNQSESSKESQRILYEKVCQVVRNFRQSPDWKQAGLVLKDALVNLVNHLYEKLMDELGRSLIERFKEFINDKAKTPIRSLVDGPETFLDDFVGQILDSSCEKCMPQANTETVGAEDSKAQEVVRMLGEFGAAAKFFHFLLRKN